MIDAALRSPASDRASSEREWQQMDCTDCLVTGLLSRLEWTENGREYGLDSEKGAGTD